MLHVPVLLEESLSYLVTQPNGNYIDCTYGRGGHTKSILKLLSNDGFLTAFDKDKDAYSDSKKIDESNSCKKNCTLSIPGDGYGARASHARFFLYNSYA